MSDPINYRFILQESVSEDFLKHILNFYQNFMRAVMNPSDLKEAIRAFSGEIRKWYNKSVFDYSPKNENLIDDLMEASDLGYTKFIYWSFALPFRFQIEVGEEDKVSVPIKFVIEIKIFSKNSDRCYVSHKISPYELRGECFDESNIEDVDGSVLRASKKKVREVFSNLFSKFENEFRIIKKIKLGPSGDLEPWDL